MKNDDNPETSDAYVPLPKGQVPYLMSGELPVPTYRYEDETFLFSLDGQWKFKADFDDQGELEKWFLPSANRNNWEDIEVPGSWTVAFPELLRYYGQGWYALTFDVPDDVSDNFLNQMIIRFGAVFLQSKFWLNGIAIGAHHGGYTPIHLIANNLKRKDNVLIVLADNRITMETMPVDTYFHKGAHGWWPYGGITRSVTVHHLPDPWIFKIEPAFRPDSEEIAVTLALFTQEAKGEFELSWSLKAPDNETSNGSFKVKVIDNGVSTYRIRIPGMSPLLWSRSTPENIYNFTIGESFGHDQATVRFGYREFEISGYEMYLNGERDYWHGINRHSDYADLGPVETESTISREISVLKDLNANHVRPGHYPVDERLLSALADAGITVVEETPVYQLYFDQQRDPHLLDLATRQIAEVIERDKNNPAILAWSVGNEYGNVLPGSKVLTETMDETAKRFDPSRPTMAVIANATCVVPIDFALPYVDIIGVNQYYGWYLGDVSQAGPCMDTIHRLYPNKPIVATEFGAGAVAGTHLPDGQELGPEPNNDHSYTEDFQKWYIQQNLDQLLTREYVSGVTPWVLADFRMQWDPSTGNPHPVSGMNLKGLMTQDRSTRKISFDTVSEIYSEMD